MKPPSLRRWVQGGLFLAVLLLFARTTYYGKDLLDWPVHILFHLDPLAALLEALAVGAAALGWVWMAAGLLLAFTALLGRFFCGWACPLGTLLDWCGGIARKLGRFRRPRRLPQWSGPAVLVCLVTAAVLGLPLLALLDPLSLLLRSLTLSVHPLFDTAGKEVLGALSRSGLAPLASLGDGLFRLLDGTLLVFGRPSFLMGGLTGMVFLLVLGTELLAPRFWCAYLCPLGALLGLAARLSPLRRRKADVCGTCASCEAACPTRAADADPADVGLCLQCGACAAVCPQGARVAQCATPAVALPSSATRRALLGSLGVGAFFAAVPQIRAEERERPVDFLRPPGSQAEEEFRKRCIRCGACMRVCPRGALHPTLLQAGLDGLWTPRLVPRIGYCEYHCRLCGQVCPTGAIGYLAEGVKENTVIGIAVFDADRCLPYRKLENCMVCEEHCPTNPKAIVFSDEMRTDGLGVPRAVKIPRLVEERCIGCGICENKCPLPGRSAIVVTREIPGNLSEFYS